MQKRFGEIADKITKFMTKKGYVAFLDNNGNLLYSSLTGESEQAVKKLSSVFPVWNIGDYQLKKLPKSNIIVYKVSPHIVLALESYEKEGVLIVVGKRLEENFANLFKDLDVELPAPEAKGLIEVASKKSSLELVQESSSARVTEKTYESIPTGITSEKIEEGIQEPPMGTPSVGNTGDTVTVSFPIIVDKKSLKKVKDPDEVKVLELCDGGHTIDDIAEELHLPKVRVMITTGDYSAKGVIRYISGFKKMKR
ncbi:MAG: hypothetical protein WED07_14960 [Candidatus Freyarchaeum deiterrae]